MPTRILRLLMLTVLLLGTCAQLVLAEEQFKQKVIDKAKKAVVTIHGNASRKAYEPIEGA